jgi:superfamily I DNA/RNA helicase
MRLTHEQQEIQTEGAKRTSAGSNTIVIAFAGAGKTTTLKSVAEAIPMKGCYLAFNKAIAEEAMRKFVRTKCSASTMHSLAFSVVRDITHKPANLNARDVRDSGLLRRFNPPRVKGWSDYRIGSAICRTLAVYCNSADADVTLDHAKEALISSVGDPDLIHSDERAATAQHAIDQLVGPLAEMTQAYFDACLGDGRLSHDIYLKLLDLDSSLSAQAFRGFKYLMVDEAQDINPVQRAILVKSGLPLIAVGDPYQQIYSWRGAENALASFEGEKFYLTQSFRFGEDIAEQARRILSSRPDGGPEQQLIGAGRGIPANYKGAKVAMICRTNIGMIDEALRLMNTGKRVHVDNVEGLVSDVRSAQALFCEEHSKVTSQEIRQFDSWHEMVAEAEESGGALARLVQLVEDNRVGEVESLLHRQVKTETSEFMVCTAHRSKGLEFPAVALGRDWKDIDSLQRRFEVTKRESAKSNTQALEEWNALYVAATRPMVRLKGLDKLLEPPQLDKNADSAPAGYTPMQWEAS